MLYKSTQQQPVSGQNRRLTKHRHLSSCGSKLQSRARGFRPSVTEADEADLGNSKTHALSSQDEAYSYIPYKEDIFKTKSPLGNAVKVWLFHHHYL